MKKTIIRFVLLPFLLLAVSLVSAENAFGKEGEGLEQATFAAGCFWCVEAAFEQVEGVEKAISGYTGGQKKNPTYREVGSGTTGHTEAVQVWYDPEKISYQKLLAIYWQQFDPTDPGGSFVDRGSQYRSAIFYHTPAQKQLAVESKQKLSRSGLFDKPIVTPILPEDTFYPAEEYHQDFFLKNTGKYKRYRSGSGRDQFINKVWKNRDAETVFGGKPSREELRQKLTSLQYEVTQNDGTEPPFRNEYWDNTREGIYVDVVSGEPLFSSGDKFKSGSGWPSFTRPLQPENIVQQVDRRLGMERIEIRSRHGNSHLGHLFYDGPAPTRQRYCINSAALRFIPKENLAQEGYAEYIKLFIESPVK